MTQALARAGETYIGSGVFVRHNSDLVTLRLPHVGSSTTIHLTPNSFATLAEYVREMCDFSNEEPEV